MGKFSTKTKGSVTKTTNIAGGESFTMNAETELTHAVLTTFLEDKAYESGSARIKRIAELVSKNKAEFVAKLAIVARNEFNLRSVSHVLVGELAKTHKGDSLVKDTFVSVCIRPDDMCEIVAYIDGPVPKQIKRGVRHALLNFNRYQLAKYRGEGKNVSLVDLFNLCHPNPEFANKEQKDAWKDLVNGDLASFDTWETEVSSVDNADKKKVWESLVAENKLGYMALLRNLNNLIKNYVSNKTIKTVVAKLTDADQVAKSRQLPFRFLTAYENVKGNRVLTDAISEAMDIAVSNTPELSGNTLIAVDCSGSMNGDPITKASIFAATLAKANTRSDVLLYDTRCMELAVSSRLPVIDIADKIKKETMGGGTNTSLVFTYAALQKKKYSRFIIISDNESWSGMAVQRAYELYKTTTGTDPFVYAIDIAGYGTTDLKGSKKVFHLVGWSSRLLDFIGAMEKEDGLINYIKKYEIKKVSTSEEGEE